MKKMRILAAAAAFILMADSLAPLKVQASSVTDIQQQAEDLFNENISRAIGGRSEDSSGSDSSDANSVDNADDSKDKSDEEANQTDIEENSADQFVTVEINSRKDFDDVVKNCHTDTWSTDKKIVLNTDLDFKNKEFKPIRSFGGIFEGNGHTLKGVIFSKEVSDTGVFGTVRRFGTVRNLNVEGSITPADSQQRLGGIAGKNYGTIEGCTFDGEINADRRLGGIAGYNGKYGTIKKCESDGTMTGKAACGGIVGYNEGTVSQCRNDMKVNTTYRDTTLSLTDLTGTLDNALQSGDLLNSDNLELNGDTGGIAGFSSGVITSCTNNAVIGYEHVGYNIGGIVGRSLGFLRNNVNNGIIYGRKDVGGIAGQMQPYLSVEFAESALSSLDGQLDTLNSLINTGLDNADSYSSQTLKHLQTMNGLTGTARDAAKSMADEGADTVNDAAKKVNDAVDAIKSSLSTFSDVSNEAETFLSDVQNAGNELSNAISTYIDSLELSDEDRETIEQSRDDFESALSELNESIQNLKTDIENAESDGDAFLSKIETDFNRVEEAYHKIRSAVTSITDALSPYIQNIKNVKEAARNLYQKVKDARELVKEEAYQKVQEALDDLKTRIDNARADVEDIKNLHTRIEELQNDLKELLDPETSEDEIRSMLEEAGVPKENIDDFIEKWNAFRDAFETLENANGSENWTDSDGTQYSGLDQIAKSSIWSEPDTVSAGESDSPGEGSYRTYYIRTVVRSAVNRITDALDTEVNAVEDLLSALNTVSPYLDAASDTGDIRAAVDNIKNVLNNSPDFADQLSGAFDTIASLNLRMNGVSDSLRQSGDSLYQSLGRLQNEATSLNSDLSQDTDQGVDNLRSITSQLDTIGHTLKDAADQLSNSDDNRSIEDTSDEDIKNVYQGRMTECVNYGEVQADTNVGGITGLVGIEYDLDPETDIKTTGDTSLDYIFRVRCIMDNCTNNGDVDARDSYSGGIAGHMEMGLVADSRNFGDLDSQNSYVGGIAGYTTGLVRNSYAKCDLSGEKYIGGIAGYGVSLHDNYSMVNVTDENQYVGAIAGRVKNTDKSDVYQNYYYATDLYGIDGVSYAGIAEGMEYEALTQKFLESDNVSGSNERFTQLTLTFETDDSVIRTMNVSYGDTVPSDKIPAVPKKEGFHGKWSRTDFSSIVSDETITAEYSRIVTLLSSNKKRAGGLPVAEITGEFHEKDELKAEKLTPQNGETERWKITVPNDGTISHEIRYLAPDDATDVTVYVLENGKKTKVKTSELGKYITFTTDESARITNADAKSAEADTESYDIVFSANVHGAGERMILTVALIAAGAVIVLILILHRIRKKRRGKGQES